MGCGWTCLSLRAAPQSVRPSDAAANRVLADATTLGGLPAGEDPLRTRQHLPAPIGAIPSRSGNAAAPMGQTPPLRKAESQSAARAWERE